MIADLACGCIELLVQAWTIAVAPLLLVITCVKASNSLKLVEPKDIHTSE